MERMTFNGSNLDKVKEFAGDACELRPVYDNNGVVWGQRATIKTTDGLVELNWYDVLIKDADGIRVYRNNRLLSKI